MAVGSVTRTAFIVGVLIAALPVRAHAQVLDDPTPSAETPISLVQAPRTGWSAPALHVSLSAVFASLQALDTATTLGGVRGGTGVEANPLLGGLADHPAALIGLKAGLTTATIVSMRGLAKHHPRAAALTLIVLNAGSAFVVGSNFQIAQR